MDLALDLLKENRRHVILIVILSLATGALSAALIAVVARGVTDAGSARFGFIAATFVALCFVILACRQGHRYAVTLVSNRLEIGLRSRASASILACSLRSVERRRPAELMAVLTRDVESVSGFVLSLPTFLSNVALLLGALIYLGFTAGLWALFVLTTLIALGVLAHGQIVISSMPLFREIREHHSRLMRSYQDLVFGVKELKMDEALSRRLFTRRILPESAAIAKLNLDAVARHSAGLNAAQLTMYALLGVVVFVFPFAAPFAADSVATFVMVILFAMGPAESIANLHPLFSNARVAMSRLQALERELAATPDAAGAPASTLFECVELSDVRFSYREPGVAAPEGACVGPLSLRVQRGELVFITGGNGSGKTTLAKLLCGLYAPESGAVRINGEPVGSVRLQALREHFCVVFSDSHPQGAAIDPAILADPKASALAEALHVRRILNGWEEQSMDELSFGQRRRLALFAALTRTKDVYLLDEPAANLDAQAKAWFYRVLLPQLHASGATMIVISHDDQFFDVASRVVVLRDGRIVAERAGGAPRAEAVSRAGTQARAPSAPSPQDARTAYEDWPR